jgi:hypothetical protein
MCGHDGCEQLDIVGLAGVSAGGEAVDPFCAAESEGTSAFGRGRM